MTLNHGLDLVAIPGPSILPERVRIALSQPMPDIYSGELVEMSERVMARLPAIARTLGRGFAVIGNGHAAWQMAIDNLLQPGDRVLVLESGLFATLWGEIGKDAGLVVDVIAGNMQDPVDPAVLHDWLAADDGSIRAIMVAHTDTASSVRNDLRALRKAIDDAGHDALLMVDGIASIGTEQFEMDAWGVDVAIGASQKGLMCPPGLALVWAGDRAMERYRSLPTDRPRTGYVDWEFRVDPEADYQHYAGTAPVLHIRALNAAFELIDEEGGLDAVWERHRVLADGVRAAVDAWSTPNGIAFNIGSPGHRSNAVTTIRTGSINSIELGRICRDELGVTIGVGLGGARDSSFRIGHMGHLNAPMILGALGSIEAALAQMGAAIGSSGVAAAAASIGSR